MASFIKRDGTIVPMQERHRAIYGVITEIKHTRNFLSAEDEIDIVVRVSVPERQMLSGHYQLGLQPGPVKVIQ